MIPREHHVDPCTTPPPPNFGREAAPQSAPQRANRWTRGRIQARETRGWWVDGGWFRTVVFEALTLVKWVHGVVFEALTLVN